MSSKKEFESISFDLPKNQSNVIKVIGVGGGGSNAMYEPEKHPSAFRVFIYHKFEIIPYDERLFLFIFAY